MDGKKGSGTKGWWTDEGVDYGVALDRSGGEIRLTDATNEESLQYALSGHSIGLRGIKKFFKVDDELFYKEQDAFRKMLFSPNLGAIDMRRLKGLR